MKKEKKLKNKIFHKYLFNNEWRKTNRNARITKWLKRKEGLLIEKVRNNEKEWKVTFRKKEKRKQKNCEKVNVWEIKIKKK